MRRRHFVGLATGAAVGWAFAARAQPQGGMHRIGALMAVANDPVEQAVAANLVQGLSALDWHEGRNLRIDWRWVGAEPALFKRYAAELVSLRPDVLLGQGSPSVEALRARPVGSQSSS